MPWTSSIFTIEAVLTVQAKLASGSSGGSLESTSWTPPLRIAVVQLSPGEKSVVGLSVNVVGPPVTAALCRPDAVQLIVNQGSATVDRLAERDGQVGGSGRRSSRRRPGSC